MNMDETTIDQKLDLIFKRGVINKILPSEEEFRKKIKSGKFHIYMGFDATAPNVTFRACTKFYIT